MGPVWNLKKSLWITGSDTRNKVCVKLFQFSKNSQNISVGRAFSCQDNKFVNKFKLHLGAVNLWQRDVFFLCLPLGFLPVVWPTEQWWSLRLLVQPCYVALGRALICGCIQSWSPLCIVHSDGVTTIGVCTLYLCSVHVLQPRVYEYQISCIYHSNSP